MPPRSRRRRGWIEQLPSGSYRVGVYAGADPLTGRPRRPRETVSTYEDSVRVPEADDVDRIQRLAVSVDIELRNRRSLEAQHEQDQTDARADQLNRWHHNDQTTTVDTAGDADDD